MPVSVWWDYRIRAYYPPNRGGGVAIETVHRGEASRDVEIAVFKERIRKGEISHIDVIDIERCTTQRIYE